MRSRMYLSRTTRLFLLGACVGVTVLVGMSQNASAELRKFAVMLAHSPKSQLNANGLPSIPLGGLFSVEDIRKQYFDRSDPNLDSFTEYWEEISYGDVIVTGDVFEWVALPWAFDPNAPNGGTRASAQNFIDLHANVMNTSITVNPPVPAPFAYGAGEDFCDREASLDTTPTPITPGRCGALIITDSTGTDGNNLRGNPPPVRGSGLNDVAASGIAVWTPGERFIDLDDDNRWDGVDEVNDLFCPGPNGCQVPLCSLSRTECVENADCPVGETCILRDPIGVGPRGCNTPGCGDLRMPWIDWNGNNDADDVGTCTVPDWLKGDGITPQDRVSKTTGLLECGDELSIPHCQLTGTPCTDDDSCDSGDSCQTLDNSMCEPIPGYTGRACPGGFCPPNNCIVPDAIGNLPQLPPCCTGDPESDADNCLDPNGAAVAGLTCNSEIVTTFDQCCEFVDSTNSGGISVPEPFEDFMVRWNPQATSPLNAWVRVTDDYVRNNYPGDVEALIARTGNGVYDAPDVFIDRGNSKMMQDASINQFGWITPEPGSFYTSGSPNFEQAWFPTFWTQRYGSTPPPWPGGSGGFIAANSPIMRPFNPAEPLPPVIQNPTDATLQRWFQANEGGWNGSGRGKSGSPSNHNIAFDLGSDDFSSDGRILPDEEFGYYDGWVEHDDLASSRYHHAGDKRLGEITSPSTDTVTYPGGTGEIYTAIAGADLGQNSPDRIAVRDQRNVAAGPMAVNIHGEKGFDAGDVCILEWLTWRTDGTSPTVSRDWELENGPYHPFAGPSSPRVVGDPPVRTPIGFADYNLDGMIDQGEVRPELSESYSVDSNPGTANDGTGTDYPFNRRRMMEDVVEALDFNIDWDDFVDPNRGNTVSGIILVPGNSYSDTNLFPFSPRYFPVHTEDTGSLQPFFHDLVTCQTCRDFPADIGYAAHEYLHGWEGYPDLYDYDVFEDVAVINCPIGIWDIMAGSRGNAGLVHPVPVLKERSRWIESVDLTTVLTPGVETTLTLPPAERVRDESYFFLENSERPGERQYFWSAGNEFDEGRFPGKGMLILHAQDIGVNNEAITSQQRTTPANFRIIQADGNGDLEACSSTGNAGDFGDMWPGASNATTFNFNSIPRAVWTAQNRWTGMSISNIQTDGAGSVVLTLTLTPTNIPSLKFIDPPGGETVGNNFQVRFEATDVFGGTDIQLYYTTDPLDLTTSFINLIGSRVKGAPGTVPSSMNWNITGVPDGRYSIFAKLIPGLGADGFERQATEARASRNNAGNGTLVVNQVDISASLAAKARSETWVATCINAAGTEWTVYSSLTQREPQNPVPGPFPHAFTCPSTGTCTTPYTSIGGEVTFSIIAGDVPFTERDSFNFTTTGITAPSAAVEILDGKISAGPRAVIVAAPVTIRPGETVSFDASESSDPESQPLTYTWTFGDGSPIATGETTTHVYRAAGTFVAVLKVTNRDGLFDENSVEVIVFNNSPTAAFTSTVTSGSAPLTVNLSASGSSDTESDAAALIFQWDLGDGSTVNDQGESGTLFQAVEHVFERNAAGILCTPTAPCTFVISLTVTDEGGKSDTAMMSILVGNSDPVAVVTASPDQGDSPLTVEFDASGSSDPDGQSLTITWDFDDGSPAATGATVSHVYSHTASTAQLFTPTATIEDGFGGTASWTGAINVGPVPEPNDAPDALFAITPGSAIGIPGDTFTFDAAGTTDAQQSKDSLIYKWAFDDGIFGTGVTVTHTFLAVGTFQVELTVTDERGASSIMKKTVNINPPVNRPPTAVIATGPRNGTAPALLSFDGRNSFDLDGGQALTYSWEFRDSGELIDTLTGSLISRTFRDPGTFSVVLTVDDGNGGTDSSQPVVVTIAAPPDGTTVGVTDPESGRPSIPDSATQRPQGAICGLGMLTSLFGSFFGLSLMVAARGRRRRREP